jgi:hypothetical protein
MLTDAIGRQNGGGRGDSTVKGKRTPFLGQRSGNFPSKIDVNFIPDTRAFPDRSILSD